MSEHEYDEALHNEDNEFSIVDLDPLATTYKKRAGSKMMQGQRLPSRVRLGMALLTIIGSIALLFIVVYNLIHNIPDLGNEPPITAVPHYQTYFALSVSDGVAYINAQSLADGATTRSSKLDAVQVSNGKRLWHYHGDLVGTPLIAAGSIYVNTKAGNIEALRAHDGSVRWHYNTVASLIAVTDGVVYLSGLDGHVDALQSDTGSLLWHYTSTPVAYIWGVTNNIVYIDIPGEGIDAVRISDGLKLWHYTSPLTIEKLLVGDGVAYLYFAEAGNFQSGSVDAVRINDGISLWRYQTLTHIDQLTVQDGVVCIYSVQDGGITALRMADGSMFWQHRMGGTNEAGAGGMLYIIAGGTKGVIYVNSRNEQGIYALQANDGSVLWHYQALVDSIQIEQDIVYLHATKKHTVDALHTSNGIPFWQHPTGPDIVLTVISGVVYVHTPEQTMLDALRGSDGSLLWHYKTNGDVSLTEAGVIYIATPFDNTVDVLQISNGNRLWRYHADIQPQLPARNFNFER